MMRVEDFVDREKMEGIAGAKAVREFRERVALFEENKLYLGVVDGRKDVEDFGDLPHSIADDVAGERDVADRCPQKAVAGRGGSRDETAEGVFRVDFRRKVLSTPDQRFRRVEREADGLSFLL